MQNDIDLSDDPNLAFVSPKMSFAGRELHPYNLTHRLIHNNMMKDRDCGSVITVYSLLFLLMCGKEKVRAYLFKKDAFWSDCLDWVDSLPNDSSLIEKAIDTVTQIYNQVDSVTPSIKSDGGIEEKKETALVG